MLAQLLSMSLIAATNPMDPPPTEMGCALPLRLSLSDLASMGNVGRRLTQPDCLASRDSSAIRFYVLAKQSVPVASVILGSFKIAGETVSYGLNLRLASEQRTHGMLPGRYWRNGSGLEEVRLSPTLVLPPQWQRAVDTATYPVLILGTAAIGTAVILRLLGH